MPAKAGPPNPRCEILKSKSYGAEALPLPMQPTHHYTEGGLRPPTIASVRKHND